MNGMIEPGRDDVPELEPVPEQEPVQVAHPGASHPVSLVLTCRMCGQAIEGTWAASNKWGAYSLASIASKMAKLMRKHLKLAHGYE